MKRSAVFIWSNFGPYHVDRLEAAAAALQGICPVFGIEIAKSTDVYPWQRSDQIKGTEIVTLFPDRNFESVPAWRQLWAMVRMCRKLAARDVFLCHYERIDTHLLAWILRITGCRVYLMIESKFDDRQRYVGREIFKKAFFLPYMGAIVGGDRSRDYLRFFGFDAEKIYFGYDTVSMDRIRRLAGSPPAPAGIGFKDRHFTIIARLVPKKNIITALKAYAEYCKLAKAARRQLHICGSGELEGDLRAAAGQLGLDGVVFRGFIQSTEIARELSTTLALILPSVEEQWGLVVNEALAMGVPILCSINAGARDRLVKTSINGYLFEPDNPDGLSHLLHNLSSEENEWRRLSEGSSRLSSLADTARFGESVAKIILDQSARGYFAKPAGKLQSIQTPQDFPSQHAAPAHKITWPAFFLVGAPKAGTTAIVEALEKHPQIYSAPVKEPNFFNPDVWVEDILPVPKLGPGAANKKQFFAVIRNEKTYLSLYENAPEFMVAGDYSVNYLRSRLAPNRISKCVSNAKIIIVLRNPIERAYSHYLMDCSIGRVNDDFGNVIDKHIRDVAASGLQYDNYVQCGLYADHIDTYQKIFGKENVLILLYDDLVNDFEGCIDKILHHIELSEENFVFQRIETNTAKVSKIPMINYLIYKSGLKSLIIRYVPQIVKNLGIKFYYEGADHQERMSERDRSKLIDIHRADIQRTAKIISRDLSHWLQ